MEGSFIPPPFPFPEAWPRVFVEQQQRGSRQWLTPTTFVPTQWQAATPTTFSYQPVGHCIPAGAHLPTVDAHHEEEELEEDDDSECEYGYVLSDEWRERFQSSVRLQQVQRQQQKHSSRTKTKKKKPKPKPKQTVNAEALAAVSASRSGHLQREIQAARTRELARKWKRRTASPMNAAAEPQIEALETHLNMLFDEYCDAFQPVVWPHDRLQ
ncbi:hypothetical protein PR003_g5495 [Phytophthora rubi]|uniref:Uncharacterized protein n=1 Tax=Phytophthora rubi TaxID=129364 RepID=A0A6A4FSK9_9STRA|nr:hypothetical protein PR003_g5495 [Phytophthora rubi]